MPACCAACPRVIFMECPSVRGNGQPETGKRIPPFLRFCLTRLGHRPYTNMQQNLEPLFSTVGMLTVTAGVLIGLLKCPKRCAARQSPQSSWRTVYALSGTPRSHCADVLPAQPGLHSRIAAGAPSNVFFMAWIMASATSAVDVPGRST
jgi:hypothetical protein